MELRVLTAADLVWSMTSTSAVNPASYKCGAGQYQRGVEIDPFPGYPHNPALVAELLAACEKAYPLNGSPGELCLLEHEFLGRTNGLTWEDTIWRRPDGTEWQDEIVKPDGEKVTMRGQGHTIVLCAKRIPIAPAMTRYLVTHEYGHAAFNHTRRLLGFGESEDAKLEAEYLRIRGAEIPKRKAEGGRWHELASEIIANDFRCIVMRAEIEFWPHDVPQMGEGTPISGWWWEAIDRAHGVPR